jgi:hypothetical protein
MSENPLNSELAASGVLTSIEYDEIDGLNRLLDLERAQGEAANPTPPTTQKQRSEPRR